MRSQRRWLGAILAASALVSCAANAKGNDGASSATLMAQKAFYKYYVARAPNPIKAVRCIQKVRIPANEFA